SGAVWNGDRIDWDAAGERLYINIKTDTAWDDSLDLKIRLFYYRNDVNNDTVAFTWYCKGGADGTTTGAWNVKNAVASTLAASAATTMKTDDLTLLTGGNWTAGHMYSNLWIHNEAGRLMKIYGANVVVE
ncbi:unnamed protein product, partial [marine sediment metagenome]